MQGCYGPRQRQAGASTSASGCGGERGRGDAGVADGSGNRSLLVQIQGDHERCEGGRVKKACMLCWSYSQYRRGTHRPRLGRYTGHLKKLYDTKISKASTRTVRVLYTTDGRWVGE